MSFKPAQTLILQDQENNETYTLYVSDEDYQRAQTDLQFAEALLFHARANRNTNNTIEPSVEESEEPPEDHDSNHNTLNTEPQAELNTKQCWSYEETLCLINSMEVHMDALQHPKKKKGVFEQVANDVCSNGFSVSAVQCQSKWKSLIRSYKICKDHKTKTGRGPSRFHFYEQLDLLLGTKPSNKCSHALEASEDIQQLDETIAEHEDTQVSSADEVRQEKVRRKRTPPEGSELKTLIDMKKQEYKRREERHEEKCTLERKKIELLGKILEKH